MDSIKFKRNIRIQNDSQLSYFIDSFCCLQVGSMYDRTGIKKTSEYWLFSSESVSSNVIYKTKLYKSFEIQNGSKVM